LNIENFKSKIGQVAVPNKYIVNFNAMPNFNKHFPTLGNDLSLLAKSVNLPNMDSKEISTNHWGFERSIISSIDYDAFYIDFLIDKNYEVRKGFESWYNDVFNKKKWQVNYFDDYNIPEVEIIVLNKQDEWIHNITLYNVYPIKLGPVQMAYGKSDYGEFNVTFKFWNWDSDSTILSTPTNIAKSF